MKQLGTRKRPTFEQRLTLLLEEYFEIRKIIERYRNRINRIQREQDEQNRREVANMIAILLDETLSINERLRRINGVATSSLFVKEFKSNFIKFIHKNKELFEKKQKEQKEEIIKGILNLSLNDLFPNKFLKISILNLINFSLKNNEQNITNLNKQVITRNKKSSDNIEKIINKIPNRTNLPNSLDKSLKHIRFNSRKLQAKTPISSTLETRQSSIEPNRVSQVELLQKRRMEKAYRENGSFIHY